jgi:hypothetical protein
MTKKAFLVIVDHPDGHEPWIGDIHWTLKPMCERSGWEVHTTDATAEMLAHHGVPYPPENVECRTCGGKGTVGYNPCYSCSMRPENVETPT